MTTSFESSDTLEMFLCKLAGGGSLGTVHKKVLGTFSYKDCTWGTPYKYITKY